MLERLRCYIILRKTNKFLRIMKRIGEITNDKDIVKKADIALYVNTMFKKRMWHNRKLIEAYSLGLIRSCLY